MKSTKTRNTAALAVILAVAACLSAAAAATAESREEKLARADGLLLAGRLAEAEGLYREVFKEDPASAKAALALGRIKLFKNTLPESETWLRKAVELDPGDRTAPGLLAENFLRRDEFGKAAEWLDAAGARPVADFYRHLAAQPAYSIEGGPVRTVVPFIQTDPLPLIGLRINGEEAFFLIDTGGTKIHLNADFAERLKLDKQAEQTATYAGGRQAKVWQAVAAKVEIGDFTVRNVPVVISERRGPGLPGFDRPISGVLGTVFLYHFLFTFDYPAGNLVLERRTAENSARLRKTAEASGWVQVPFWLAGDHFMLAQGAVNNVPAVLFVDTGMAGGGFSVSERLQKEAGIKLPEESGVGEGGGGQVQVRRIRADLALGAARESGIEGFFGVMPPGMDARFGIRQDGIISHGFFRPYKCVFDFLAMTLYLEKK